MTSSSRKNTPKMKIIIIHDTMDATMEGYTDIKEAASIIGVSESTMRRRLKSGIHWIAGKFVGYGELHKSNRGSS